MSFKKRTFLSEVKKKLRMWVGEVAWGSEFDIFVRLLHFVKSRASQRRKKKSTENNQRVEAVVSNLNNRDIQMLGLQR